MEGKKTRLRFQGNHRSKKGIVSMLISLLVLAGFLTASIMSGIRKGEAGIVVGYIGMVCLVCAITGFVLGLQSLKEKDIRFFQPIFGVAVNGILIFVLFALYLTGILI